MNGSFQQTFSIIKPDSVAANKEWQILEHLTQAGLRIAKIKRFRLSEQEVRGLYAEHAERPFFPEILEFMQSSEIVALVLEHIDAVALLRKEMGATNSADAEPNTIRGKWGDKSHIMRNCVHGSDSVESAKREIGIIFNDCED